jgi:multiple sugar transport system ATP-binding protein
VAAIQIQNLHKSFTDFVAVHDSNLTLKDGNFVVLLGPSGCGKTTTLRMIAGLEYPTSGSIRIDNKDVTYLRPRERDIAMVFQLFALYPHMGVRENLAFPLKNEGLPATEIDKRVKEAAEILRIEHLLGSRLSGLAGGDRQRVALGRAIVRQPKAFLMDEPLGVLDAEFRELMCLELRKLHERLKTTTVFVTHDQNEAMALADEIVVMDQGRILQFDTPEGVYNFPSCVFVAKFIGRPPMNLVPIPQPVLKHAERVELGGSHVPIPRLLQDSQAALFGIRPEHVHISNDSAHLHGQVAQVEYFGSHWIITVDTTVGPICAMATKNQRVTEGSTVGVSFKSERAVLFDVKSQLLIPSEASTKYRQGVLNG